jgi:hypothetical protein
MNLLPCLPHGLFRLILLDLIFLITFDKDHKSWSSSLCRFLQLFIISSLFSTHILLSTLLSNILCVFSSLNIRDQVLRSYRSEHINKLRVMVSHWDHEWTITEAHKTFRVHMKRAPIICMWDVVLYSVVYKKCALFWLREYWERRVI